MVAENGVVGKKRIYAFLAERYMPYWFKKNFKTTTCQISFLDLEQKSNNEI